MPDFLARLIVIHGIVAFARLIGHHPLQSLGVAVAVILISAITPRWKPAATFVFLAIPVVGVWSAIRHAHIRPVTDQGQNRVDNGLLLRSDVHTLFDRGYLGVHPKRRTLMVSPRLRAEWGNGEEFYERASSAEPISLPGRKADHPNTEFLAWHAETLFLAS